MSHVKDPNAKLDYAIDWSAWLGADTIATSTWVVPAGITQATPAPSNTATTTTIWLSGGTAGSDYAVVNRVTTVAGRIEDRTLQILVRER